MAAMLVLAKQKLTGSSDDAGSVKVSLWEETEGWILEIQDSGVGMAEEELCGSLLDFGRSFWRSDRARMVFPGLASSGFQSTGRYGIGFFSVFMLGVKDPSDLSKIRRCGR